MGPQKARTRRRVVLYIFPVPSTAIHDRSVFVTYLSGKASRRLNTILIQKRVIIIICRSASVHLALWTVSRLCRAIGLAAIGFDSRDFAPGWKTRPADQGQISWRYYFCCCCKTHRRGSAASDRHEETRDYCCTTQPPMVSHSSNCKTRPMSSCVMEKIDLVTTWSASETR